VDAALDKMFEPFFSTKAVGEGTGLGLWISWSIAREHGGSIAAANRPEGGALFTVRLPVGG
jgi:two-component system sensor histidine kinase HupT/HoxJ